MSESKFFKITCGVFYDRQFMCGFVSKRKEGEEEELVLCESEGAWELYVDGDLDDYSDYVRENSSYAFTHEEEISEEEFNNSDDWEEPTPKEIAVLSQD